MDILIKTPFIQTLLKTTQHNVPERDQLENIFQDFALVVASVCDRADKKNALRILNYTQIEVQAICKQMEATGMPEYMMTYAIKAEQLIKAENGFPTQAYSSFTISALREAFSSKVTPAMRSSCIFLKGHSRDAVIMHSFASQCFRQR